MRALVIVYILEEVAHADEQDLGVVDREWVLCLHHQRSLPLYESYITCVPPGLAACWAHLLGNLSDLTTSTCCNSGTARVTAIKFRNSES